MLNNGYSVFSANGCIGSTALFRQNRMDELSNSRDEGGCDADIELGASLLGSAGAVSRQRFSCASAGG
jgi:hypothetical protein